MGANKHKPTGEQKQAAKRDKLKMLIWNSAFKIVRGSPGTSLIFTARNSADAVAAAAAFNAITEGKITDRVKVQDYTDFLFSVPTGIKACAILVMSKDEVSSMQKDMLDVFLKDRHFYLPV